jgi:hypothetical protein
VIQGNFKVFGQYFYPGAIVRCRLICDVKPIRYNPCGL